MGEGTPICSKMLANPNRKADWPQLRPEIYFHLMCGDVFAGFLSHPFRNDYASERNARAPFMRNFETACKPFPLLSLCCCPKTEREWRLIIASDTENSLSVCVCSEIITFCRKRDFKKIR
ncbi:hypothetical protein CEXT_407601 [Caerostris extrusa]|uniref:Uncharacterized protein n=1 Tax=Caerostris extrusa TaxID=172846 RepID=A0AAV4TNT9_CAEEX|nr:hypothetical protein CEXT_407601 [Caerostris extrusa]